MYGIAGQHWYLAQTNYEQAQQALLKVALDEALSHLGEAIVYLQRALELGHRTLPHTILEQSQKAINVWYEQFLELIERLW